MTVISTCSLLAAFVWLGSAACAGAPPPRANSAVDPSNPSSAEGAPLPTGRALAREADLPPPEVESAEPAVPSAPGGGSQHAGHGHDHGGTGAVAPPDAPQGEGNTRPMSEPAAKKGAATIYTCPMHPEVRSSKPGRCPKCGMKLVPAKPDAKPEKNKKDGATPDGGQKP